MTVSVIIPVYNSESTIIRSLESVCNQSYKDVEIIIINDGSTDNTLSVITSYKVENKDVIILIINKPNGGVSTARNAGMKLASGFYIAFLDSDDAWYANKLAKQISIMKKNNNIDFLGSIITKKSWNRYIFKKIGYLTKIELTELMFKFCFQPSTVIFKRNIIDYVGYFDDNQRYAEEGNYFMRINYNGFGCYLINEKLSYFGTSDKFAFGDGGLSGNLKEMQLGEIKNHKYALDKLGISKKVYYAARFLSNIKYLRRIILVKLRHL